MPPDQAAAASDTAAAPAASAPAVVAPPPASAPAADAPASTPAPAPAESGTLLTAAAAAPATTDPLKPETDPEAPKAEGEETDAEKAAKAEAEQHAPEEYEPFKLPDNVSLDDGFITEFKSVAKELDLPQGKAQRLAELGAKMQADSATRFVTELQSTVDRNAQEWAAAVKKDPELGGDQHAEVMGVAVKALDTFGSPEFKKFLDESRLGSNPEMVRLLYRAGKAISQDTVTSGRQAAGLRTDADVFYAPK